MRPPAQASFEAIPASAAQPRDLTAALDRAGLPRHPAGAASNRSWDDHIRAETEETVARADGGAGTPDPVV